MWKIGIIDDDRGVLQGIKRAIPWDELNAEWAGEALNGEEGLAMIQSACPDIVITDLYMPVMNGLDMIEQLRQNGYKGKVIILSGYSDFEYARQALRLNVSDYLSKPVSVPTLKSVLGEAIADLEKQEERRVKQDELLQKLRLYEPFVEKEWVKSAAAGTLQNSSLDMEIPTPYRYWSECDHTVLGIELVRNQRSAKLSLSDWSLLRFAISNIIGEVTQGIFVSFDYTDLHTNRSVIIVHSEPTEPADRLRERLEQLGVRLIDCVKSYLKLKIRIGIGERKNSIKDIGSSTEEAFRVIDLNLQPAVPGYDLFVYTQELHSGDAQAPVRPIKLYLELAGAIRTSQENQARKIIRDYMTRLEKEKGITKSYVGMLAGELWGIIAFAFYEMGTVLDDIFSNECITREIADLNRPSELAEWLGAKIGIVFSSREWGGNGKHRQAVDFMMEYIHEHYAEDITLAGLADKVYISRNYLSMIFKNITGETFNNYLTRVRIEKARELLMEKKVLVYEVAEMVGYKNVPYFSTVFKKITGMNPTEIVK
ncbi:response regulator transcription factor [Paenibacillus lentus]|uniref:DNA-binding response regulator n=1 Tax=Paenibacillus lentus TaxID=1338368 RepID=A0A3S8RSL2_9BACL|nr:response regulator transcription factor [Paenibacillus lentus]AZK45939.1 DNA-binding response regulator [Paenibacillus lentus]